MRKFALLVLLLCACLGAQLAAPRPVAACSCAGETSSQSVFAASQAVFSGQVTAITLYTPPTADPMYPFTSKDITFLVESVWKGTLATQTVVQTGMGGGDCGYNFVVGQSYLVYAYRRWDTQIATGICSRTALFTETAADLALLGAGRAPQPAPAAPVALVPAPAAQRADDWLRYLLAVSFPAAVLLWLYLSQRRAGRA